MLEMGKKKKKKKKKKRGRDFPQYHEESADSYVDDYISKRSKKSEESSPTKTSQRSDSEHEVIKFH